MIKISKILVVILIAMFSLNLLAFSQELTGDWYYYNDAGNKGKSKIIINGKETTAFNFIKETIGGVEKQVAVLSGKVTTDFSYGFLGMGFKVAGSVLPKLKKAKGIKFMVMGDQKQYRCRIETDNIKDFDYFGKIFKASSAPTEVVIMFNQLTQEGWGAKSAFNTAFINQISFQTVGQPYDSILLKIWDVQVVY